MGEIKTIADICRDMLRLQMQINHYVEKERKKTMPCGPCGSAPQSSCNSAAGQLLFECCERLKVRAQICEVPIPGCAPATYPVGLEMSVSEFPNMGPDAFVSAFRLVDCRNNKHTRVEFMTAWEGIVKQGLGAIIPERPGVASVVGAVHDLQGVVVPGSLGTLGYVAEDGTVYAGKFDGDVLFNGRVITGPVTPAPNQSQISYTDGLGHVEMLYRDALNRLIQGMGAAIPAQNGAVGVIGALLDSNGNNIPGTIGYVGYQDPSGHQWGFNTPGDSFVGGDLRLMGDLLDADGNVVDFTPAGGTITSITNITSPGGATSVWKTGSVNLGGTFTAYPTGVSLEGTIVDGAASSVMEILCSTTHGRVSFHPQSPTGAKQSLWVAGPDINLSGVLTAAEFGCSSGNYYTTHSAQGAPATLLCHRDAGNQWWGVYTNGNLFVGGNATLAGTAVGSWADDVFENGYAVPSIDDMLDFAMNNKHLPHIPEQSVIKEKGLTLNTLIPSLVRTIEEMFLQIASLNDRVADLEVL